MKQITPNTIVNLQAALKALDGSIESGSPVQTASQLIQLIENALLEGSQSVSQSSVVFVPDTIAPTTPAVKEDQIRLPAQGIEPEIRAISSQCQNITNNLVSLVNEVQNTQAGLQALITSALASVTAAQNFYSAPNGAWMSFTEPFLNYNNINSNQTSNVLVNYQTHGGITIQPSQEQDLSPYVQTITLGNQTSFNTLPGDNLEIVSVQDTPSTSTPAEGSSNALAQTTQNSGSSGGSGQEPVVTFASGADVHNNLMVILTDQSTEFYDQEIYYVPPQQPCTLHGTAYVYDPSSGEPVAVEVVTDGYGWLANITEIDGTIQDNVSMVQFNQYPPIQGGTQGINTELVLQLQFDLGQELPMNQLEITVQQVGGLWPTIEGVEVSADSNEWFELQTDGGSTSWTGSSSAISNALTTTNTQGTQTIQADGAAVLGTSVWDVPSFNGAESTSQNGGFPTLRYISIKFSQAYAYMCAKGVGHPYYVEVVQTKKSSSSWFGLAHSSSNNTNVIRLPSPNSLLNIQAGQDSSNTSTPGTQIGGTVGTIAGDLLGGTVGGSIGNVLGSALGTLWGSSSSSTEVLQAGEYTDIFQGYRQCVSIQRVQPLARLFPTGVTCQLTSNSINFGTPFSAVRLLVDDDVPAGTTVQYQVSPDNGQTWQTITPTELSLPPAPYSDAFSVVTFQSPTSSVILQIQMTTTMPNATPRITGYCLEALPVIT